MAEAPNSSKYLQVFVDRGFVEGVTELATVHETLPGDIGDEVRAAEERAASLLEGGGWRVDWCQKREASKIVGRVAALRAFGIMPEITRELE